MFLEIAIVCAVVGAILLAVIPRRAKLNLPPGPRHYPLIGNLPQLAGKPGHVAMTEMAKEYGKIYTMYLPGGQR